MGLSASSLRLAMLTARKSSLEFEGQQINQQRLTLSNQTAELFNSMLTMQVPTPPDPSEFSKMVYTFNKGNGVSTLLNVSRNPSGPYTHDVTYKGPKTDNVLMKKQLNNVGFKHENDQMSAVIDGLNYPLTLNGDEEKLNDYLETKKTYDNIKNIETQKRALESMPQDKELSSSQMRQYFEALGLSSYDTPSQGKVEDVETLDDAFKNVYNSGSGNYSYRDVTLTYKAATSPITVNDKFEEVTTKYLSASSGSLTGNYEEGYDYTTNVLPNGENTEDKNITYSLINNGEDNWIWELKSVDKNTLEKLGITHTEVYGEYNQDNKFVEKKYTDGTSTYSNIIKNEYDTYSYDIYINPGYDVFSKSGTVLDCYQYTTKEENRKKYQYIVTVDGNNYLAMKEGEKWFFILETTNVELLDNMGKFEYLEQNMLKYYQNSYKKTDDGYVWNKEDGSELKISYDEKNDRWSLSGRVKTNLNPNIAGNYFLYNLETGFLDTFNEEEYNENKDKDNYANCTVLWKTIDGELTPYAKIEKDITKYEKYYRGQIYTSYDKGNTYEYVNTYQGENRQNILFKDKYGKWQHQSRYTEKQLEIEVSNIIHLYMPNTTAPPEIEKHTYDKYIIKPTKDDNNNNEDPIIVQKGQATNIGNYSITRTRDTFTIQGDGFPCDSIKKESKTQKIYESNNGNAIINRVTYDVVHNGDCPGDNKYTITATFNAWVKGDNSTWNNDEEQDGYSYDKTNHTLTLTTPNGAIAQILLRNQNNQREEDDTNLTVNKMLGFFEEVLKQFGLYGSSINYKTKLDRAKAAYIDTLDAKWVENPDDNQALYSFIDANGNKAYIYVPLEYVKDDGHVESTYAYMCETSYLENQTETISQKANIIYDENGRIVKISFDDGTVVLPEVKTEQDEDAYNAAMVKYDYEKQVYDKELSDINTKTEIIAQQDKNLEIKLKSIDSQHSAISTEIEALKKVLDSSVKSSFGTFSA